MADFLAAVIIRGVNSQHNFSFFCFATAKRKWFGIEMAVAGTKRK